MKVHLTLMNSVTMTFKIDRDVLGEENRNAYVKELLNGEGEFTEYSDGSTVAIPKRNILFATVEW